jgi:amino acid adenylation domain-containing protein
MENNFPLIDLLNLPLSANQKRLWIISQQDETDPSYNVRQAYHLKGEINVEVFKESVKLLFEKQHTMFSVFKQHNGVPYISIIPRPVSVELVDFSRNPSQNIRDEILSFAGDDSRILFDLEKGPLYRLYLLKESEQSYFFYFNIHHLIFDGTSLNILTKDLSKIYSNLIAGNNDPIEPLTFHSYDFARIEKEELSPENELKRIEYWKNKLKECPPELKFPYDHARRNDPTKLGCVEHFRISEKSSQKLKLLSQGSNSTVFKTMLSIVGILFNRYTSVNDFCIGIPVSTRRALHSHHALEILGFFVDTLPVRLVINEDDNLRKQISYTNDVFKEVLRNTLAFDKIVGALKPERVPGLNPFFQVCFSWVDNLVIPMDLAGVRGEWEAVPKGVSSFDMTFYMWGTDEYIEGEIEYNIDVLKRETILRLINNFLTLIDNLVENPDVATGSLSMMSFEEKSMIDAINDTSTEYPRDKTIIQLFEDQVNLFPDKTAVVFKNRSLTYRQLNEKTNQLARVLRNSNVTSNVPVGILVDKSVEMIVGILGILKAGGAYVPIDPEYPVQRKNFIMKDSGCSLLVTRDKYFSENIEGVVKLSLDSSDSYDADTSNVDVINKSSDLAYIIYTSGTTGLPKGTLIPQRGVVRLVRNTNYVDFTSEDRVLQTAAVVFDASTEEIFGALLNGATLYIVDKASLLDPVELGEILAKNNITIADFSSALFAQIAESHSDIFCKLKTILLGGEVLSAPHANKARKNNPQLTLVNAYGPTENSCNSTAYTIERDFDFNVPIGKPISNSTAYIFDKKLNYQPIGIVGDLYVGGDGLSLGYLNREDLNKQCFIDHPQFPGKKLYKTGDLARWLPDGNIEFHGRIDTQVKIRGFRIECEEIEAILSEIEGINEAIVKPVKFDETDIRLVAFLDVKAGFTLNFEEIKNMLRTRLPSYSVPAVYKTVDGFPITINGKTDRNALTINLSEIQQESKKIDTRELTPTQQTILKIWLDSIRTESIALEDNFFDAGGTSLLAISVVDKIEKAFKVSLSLRVFFDSPKILSLADIIDIKMNSVKTPGGIDNNKKMRSEGNIIKGEL